MATDKEIKLFNGINNRRQRHNNAGINISGNDPVASTVSTDEAESETQQERQPQQQPQYIDAPYSSLIDYDALQKRDEALLEQRKKAEERIQRTNAIGDVFASLIEGIGASAGAPISRREPNPYMLSSLERYRNLDTEHQNLLGKYDTARAAAARQDFDRQLQQHDLSQKTLSEAIIAASPYLTQQDIKETIDGYMAANGNQVAQAEVLGQLQNEIQSAQNEIQSAQNESALRNEEQTAFAKVLSEAYGYMNNADILPYIEAFNKAAPEERQIIIAQLQGAATRARNQQQQQNAIEKVLANKQPTAPDTHTNSQNPEMGWWQSNSDTRHTNSIHLNTAASSSTEAPSTVWVSDSELTYLYKLLNEYGILDDEQEISLTDPNSDLYANRDYMASLVSKYSNYINWGGHPEALLSQYAASQQQDEAAPQWQNTVDNLLANSNTHDELIQAANGNSNGGLRDILKRKYGYKNLKYSEVRNYILQKENENQQNAYLDQLLQQLGF